MFTNCLLQIPALRALEGLISLARTKALQGYSIQELADFLDGISYLPQLMWDEADRTEDFIKALRFLSEQVPEAILVLKEFEKSIGSC